MNLETFWQQYFYIWQHCFVEKPILKCGNKIITAQRNENVTKIGYTILINCLDNQLIRVNI